MASIHLEGVLVDSIGEIDVGGVINFTHLTTTGQTIASTQVGLVIPPDGSYSIDVEYGQIRIDYTTRKTERFVANVIVNSDSTATSIPELISASTPVANPVIIQMQGLVSDAVTAKEGAELARSEIVSAEGRITNIDASIEAIDAQAEHDRFEVKTIFESTESADLELLRGLTNDAESREALRKKVAGDKVLIEAAIFVDPDTGQIINKAFSYADGLYTSSELRIDGVEGEITAAVQRIETTETGITGLSAELALVPAQITATATAIVSESIAALVPAFTFNFFDSSQDWTAVNGTIVSELNQIAVTWGDIQNTALGYSASENKLIRIAIERTGGSGWVGDVVITRDGTTDVTFTGIVIAPAVSGASSLLVDFSGLNDYSGTITGVRLKLGASVADTFDITSITIGKADATTQDLQNITARVTQAELDIDANEASITQRVTVTDYTNTGVTFSNVETTLNGLDSFISLEATRVSLLNNDTIAVANTAAVDIDALEGTVTALTNTVTLNEETNQAQFTQAQSEIDSTEGRITNNTYSIVTEGDESELNNLIGLLSEIDIASIRKLELDQAFIFADAIQQLNVDISPTGALAESITNLTAVTNLTDVKLVAVADRITAVETDILGNASSIDQTNLNVTNVITGLNATVDRLDGVEIDADGNATAIATTNIRVGNTEDVVTAAVVRIDSVETDVANNSTAVSAVEGQVNNPATNTSALYTFVQTAQTTADGAASVGSTLAGQVNAPELNTSALYTFVQSAQSTADGAASVGSDLSGQVNAPELNTSALYTFVQSAQSTADGAASVGSTLAGQVNAPELNTSALYTFVQTAQTTADGAATASATLAGKVDNPETNTSALYTFVQTAQSTADGAASVGSDLSGKVDNPETNTSALYGFVQTAQSTADGAATASATLAGKVDNPETNTSALYTFVQSAQSTADGAASVGSDLSGQVNAPELNTSALYTFVQTAQSTADGAASVGSTLAGQVNAPELNTSALYTFVQTAQTTADGAATASATLAGQVDNPETNTSALYTFVQTAQTTADGAASVGSDLSGKVDNPETNTSALYGFVQTAQSTADGAVSSITSLDSRVASNESFASSQLILNSGYDTDLGTLTGRAFLGVDINNRVTGINIDGQAANTTIDFIGDKVRFIRPDNLTAAFQWDDVNDTFVFDGKIIATDSTFTGELNAATISGGTIDGSKITGTDIIGGVFQAIGTNYMRIISGDFFGANNLLEWYGAKSAITFDSVLGEAILANLTKVNGIEWKDDQGSAFTSGTIIAGTLTVSKQSPAITNTPSITTDPFGSNGGQISVNCSMFATFNSGITAGACPAAPPNPSVILRLYDDAAGGTLVNQQTFAGDYVCRQEGPEYVTEYSVNGSFTFIDNKLTTAARDYRTTATISNMPLSPTSNRNQRISILTQEA